MNLTSLLARGCIALSIALPLMTQAGTTLTLEEVVAGPQRTPTRVKRDVYRHPAQTLAFFGLRPDQTVVEIWPGGGWYTEILAPYLNQHGRYYAAQVAPEMDEERADEVAGFENTLSHQPDLYSHAAILTFEPPQRVDIRPAGGADVVLTFRNVHNWLKDGSAPAAFAAFYRALKPGGVLGVEEHRAAPGTSLQQMIDTGYVSEDTVIKLAQDAGFKLVARSDINANPKDTKDYPNGVWSLPPSYKGGDQDRERFAAIGESDRMTLKFIKPAR
ncbi:class I SAM-dependent methyltransferase [Silvimonas amylolytica]|uniref:Methyltransferase n=1 Tax=Silvimonas amylolytica TaxID=449663 RepID=A0ABQ2PMN1_9NEIS|nr:class I SAM-dependent methyltransferase [Silvimonas amylolytica]GGP26249.1 methyltransferase [Silvimonas amylolytica]